jgi:hypothetical protein
MACRGTAFYVNTVALVTLKRVQSFSTRYCYICHFPTPTNSRLSDFPPSLPPPPRALSLCPGVDLLPLTLRFNSYWCLWYSPFDSPHFQNCWVSNFITSSLAFIVCCCFHFKVYLVVMPTKDITFGLFATFKCWYVCHFFAE